MKLNSECFWGGLFGCLTALLALFFAVALYGQAIERGRFRSAQDCIRDAGTVERANECLSRWKRGL